VKFYLGAHMPNWLATAEVPLFVSHRRLLRLRRLPVAKLPWALDSGAFSEVALRGEFTTSPAEYVSAVRRYRDEIGQLEWAAPQDHMCEPWVLARSTIANTVPDAQRWTIANFLDLRDHLDDLVIPVLQGQTLDDYWRHIDAYAAAGIDLEREALVGVGSVCRRQATTGIAELIASLSTLRLHGFGVKISGLARYGWCLASADSLAWSYRGRRIRPCPHRGTMSCANCLPYALAWRQQVLRADTRQAVQLALIGGEW
jgi:hypothetical protein